MEGERWLREGWSTLFLLVGVVLTPAVAVAASEWSEGLYNPVWAGLVGLLAGLMLAKSRFPAPIAHLFSMAYGGTLVGYLVGRMIGPGLTWQERVLNLGERVGRWVYIAVRGGISRDNLIFILALCVLFWVLGYLASWYTFRRRRVWRVIIPLGVVLLVNYYYYFGPRDLTPYILVYLVSSLLYVVRIHLLFREEQWQDAHVRYSSEIHFDFLRAGLLVALVVMMVAWLMPPASDNISLGLTVTSLDDRWREAQRRVGRLFASLRSYRRVYSNPYGPSLPLGGARFLGDAVVMDVYAPPGERYYWRAAFYDFYDGRSWDLSEHRMTVFDTGLVPKNPMDLSMRKVVTQTVILYLPSVTELFAAPEPFRLSLSVRVEGPGRPDGLPEPAILYSRQVMRPGYGYRVRSAISVADQTSLRMAGRDYPAWIRQRYLQLPETISPRVKALARQIAGRYDNPYDQAVALERYLRENLDYNLDVPPPPEGQDFVDFTLFDLRAGYCDYYASSMVVMARLLGIPARMAVGYAQGEYLADKGVYRVRERDAHSWPELYFPGYGWIPFEPTVIQPPWVRPVGEPRLTVTPTPTAPPAGGGTRPTPDRGRDWDRLRELLGEDFPQETDVPLPSPPASARFPLWWGGVMLALAAVGGFAYWWSERRGMAGLTVVERAYARMERFARWIGVTLQPYQTPYERAETLVTAVPRGEAPIRRIAHLYVAERFGHARGDPEEVESLWRSLRPLLWKGWSERRLALLVRRLRTLRRRR